MSTAMKHWQSLPDPNAASDIAEIYGPRSYKGFDLARLMHESIKSGTIGLFRLPIFSVQTQHDLGEITAFAAYFRVPPVIKVDIGPVVIYQYSDPHEVLQQVSTSILTAYGLRLELVDVPTINDLLEGEDFMIARLPGVRIRFAEEAVALSVDTATIVAEA